MKNIGSGQIPSPIRSNNKVICDACQEMKEKICKAHPDYSIYKAAVSTGAIACRCRCHNMSCHYMRLKQQKLKAIAAAA